MAALRKYLSRLKESTEAASAVEFALVMPVFMAMLFGIIIFGAYLTVVHGVQQLAAEAARASISGINESERLTLARDNINANAGSYPLISLQRLQVQTASTDPATNVFAVTLRYDASNIWFFNLPAFVPAPPSTIVRSAAIQRGGY